MLSIAATSNSIKTNRIISKGKRNSDVAGTFSCTSDGDLMIGNGVGTQRLIVTDAKLDGGTTVTVTACSPAMRLLLWWHECDDEPDNSPRWCDGDHYLEPKVCQARSLNSISTPHQNGLSVSYFPLLGANSPPISSTSPRYTWGIAASHHVLWWTSCKWSPFWTLTSFGHFPPKIFSLILMRTRREAVVAGLMAVQTFRLCLLIVFVASRRKTDLMLLCWPALPSLSNVNRFGEGGGVRVVVLTWCGVMWCDGIVWRLMYSYEVSVILAPFSLVIRNHLQCVTWCILRETATHLKACSLMNRRIFMGSLNEFCDAYSPILLNATLVTESIFVMGSDESSHICFGHCNTKRKNAIVHTVLWQDIVPQEVFSASTWPSLSIVCELRTAKENYWASILRYLTLCFSVASMSKAITVAVGGVALATALFGYYYYHKRLSNPVCFCHVAQIEKL